MRRLLVTLLLATSLAACSGHGHDSHAPRLVSVAGQGEATAAPDRATVQLAIEARAEQLTAAQASADGVVAKVLAVTDGLAIAREQVQTTAIQIDPEFDYRPSGRRMLGYVVRRQVTVEVRDLALLGDLMEQALATGVNSVSPPVLSSSRERELYRAALAAAARDAELNAETLAEALDARVGRAWSVSGDGSGGRPEPRALMMRSMADGMAKAEVAETYSAGEIRYTAQVQAQFELR